MLFNSKLKSYTNIQKPSNNKSEHGEKKYVSIPYINKKRIWGSCVCIEQK